MAVESIAEFARRHGVSRQSVFNWRRRGYIVMTPGGSIDGDASDALLATRAPTYRGGQVGGNPPRNGNGAREHGTLSDALLRKEEALAELRELQLDRESGRVVAVEDVVKQIGGALVLVRAHLLRLGQTISSRAASCAGPAALRAMVDAEVSNVMAALYDYHGDDFDFGEPSKKAERLIRRKYLRRR